jgi:uncharacterized protein YecE (DUF72 family)
MDESRIVIGTAGWSLGTRHAQRFPVDGTHLERYAREFPIVEIDTSFYRPHQKSTYLRWAASVGDQFRFAVKTPRALTHNGALVVGDTAILRGFLDQVAGLGSKLSVLLVQLPPTLAFDRNEVEMFFTQLKNLAPATVRIACEPRHDTWSDEGVDDFLSSLEITRVAADPPRWDRDGSPGGDDRMAYFRLHGQPRIYYSEYDGNRLSAFTDDLMAASRSSADVWCILDNTAYGHAIGNALSMTTLVHARCRGNRILDPTTA